MNNVSPFFIKKTSEVSYHYKQFLCPISILTNARRCLGLLHLNQIKIELSLILRIVNYIAACQTS